MFLYVPFGVINEGTGKNLCCGIPWIHENADYPGTARLGLFAAEVAPEGYRGMLDE